MEDTRNLLWDGPEALVTAGGLQGSSFPAGESFSNDLSDLGLPCGVFVVFQFDCPSRALLSQPIRFRRAPPHSQSQVWDFCAHLDEER